MKREKTFRIYIMVTFLEEAMGGVETLVTRSAKEIASSGETVFIITSYFMNRAKKCGQNGDL